MATISIGDDDARYRVTLAVTKYTTQIPITFPFFDLDDIKVIRTLNGVDQVFTRGTVTSNHADNAYVFEVLATAVDDGYSGGNIRVSETNTSPQPTYTIYRDIPVARTVDFPTSGVFNVNALNTEVDKLWAAMQQLETELSRSVRMIKTDADNLTITLPSSADRSGEYLYFDANGDLTTRLDGASAVMNPTYTSLYLEGATSNEYELQIVATDPTADNVWTIPDSTDTFVGLTGSQTLTNKTLTDPVINGNITGTSLQNDGTFASTSPNKVASSQSIKAYVDAQVDIKDTLAELDDVAITGGNQPNNNEFLGYDSSSGKWTSKASSEIGVMTSSGGTFTGDVTFSGSDNIVWDKSESALEFKDGAMAVFGDGDDFKVYHDFNSTKMLNKTGDLIIGSQFNLSGDIKIQNKYGNDGIVVKRVGSTDSIVELYHDNNLKFETTSSGVKTTGTLDINGAYSLPTSIGNSGQVLRVPSSGTELEFFDNPAPVYGKNDTNSLKLEENTATDDVLLMGTNHVKGRTYAEFKTDIGLNNVENTALSTWAGSSNITTVGTLTNDLTITSTQDDGPVINLVSNDPSDAANWANEGTISFKAKNDANEQLEYAKFMLTTADISDGAETGRLKLNLTNGGSGPQASYQFASNKLFLENDNHAIRWNNTKGTNYDLELVTTTPTANRTYTLPDATGTVITTGNMNSITDIGIQQYTIQLGAGANLEFEGATGNAHETILTVTDPTQDNTITLPDATGTVALTSDLSSFSGSSNITTVGTLGQDLNLKTNDGAILSLQTSDTSVEANDILGEIHFQAPDEADGSPENTTAAKIIGKAVTYDFGQYNDTASTALDFQLLSSFFGTNSSPQSVFTLYPGFIEAKKNIKIHAYETTGNAIIINQPDTSITSGQIIGRILFGAEDEADGGVADNNVAALSVRADEDFDNTHNSSSMGIHLPVINGNGTGNGTIQEYFRFTSLPGGKSSFNIGSSGIAYLKIGADLDGTGTSSYQTILSNGKIDIFATGARSGELNLAKKGDTSVQATEPLGTIRARAIGDSDGGDADEYGAMIQFVAEADFTDTANPTAISFSTATSGAVDDSTSRTDERFRVTTTGATVTGTLSVSADTDATTTLGRALIHSPNTDGAAFSHVDKTALTDYALFQSSNGTTYINSSSGTNINFNNNNGNVASINSGGLKINTGKTILFEGATSNNFETLLNVTDPTADRTITFPDATGTVALATPYINASTLLATDSDLSGTATPTFSSSVITDDYDYYDVYLHDVKVTTNASDTSNYIWCRFQQGGSTVTGTKYMSRGYLSGMKRGDTWEAAAWAYDSQYQMYLTYPNAEIAIGVDSQATFNAHYRFYNLRSTTTYKGYRMIDGQYFSNDDNYGTPVYYQPFGFYDDATSTAYDTKVDGIVFGVGYGSPFTAGSMRLYGWKK